MPSASGRRRGVAPACSRQRPLGDRRRGAAAVSSRKRPEPSVGGAGVDAFFSASFLHFHWAIDAEARPPFASASARNLA
eukprot:6813665-Pyramimonas_sp.AAC.1